jgi:hypothetical protein
MHVGVNIDNSMYVNVNTMAMHINARICVHVYVHKEDWCMTKSELHTFNINSYLWTNMQVSCLSRFMGLSATTSLSQFCDIAMHQERKVRQPRIHACVNACVCDCICLGCESMFIHVLRHVAGMSTSEVICMYVACIVICMHVICIVLCLVFILRWIHFYK